jgi:hypothetical protein
MAFWFLNSGEIRSLLSTGFARERLLRGISSWINIITQEPKSAVETVTFMLHIRGVQGSNVGSETAILTDNSRVFFSTSKQMSG